MQTHRLFERRRDEWQPVYVLRGRQLAGEHLGHLALERSAHGRGAVRAGSSSDTLRARTHLGRTSPIA